MNNITNRIPPHQIGANESSGRNSYQIIEVYVCPTAGCGNYYGSSSMGELEKQEVRRSPHAERNPGEVMHHRNRCPSCGANRVRKYAKIIDDEEKTVALACATSILERNRISHRGVNS